ncbi:MAG: sodium-dependent transporter [Acidobacteriota bacterium]
MKSEGGRGHWGSRLGFILAAAGSAVGLGNIWKFPYITGENGGGLFVLIYLVCVLAIGIPIMIAEIIIGRRAQASPVPAFSRLGGGRLAWRLVGWMGVVSGFIILSYYAVVAGWAIDYIKLAAAGHFTPDTAAVGGMFGQLYASLGRSVLWQTLFMALTIAIVLGGVRKGIEAASRILMPALFLLLMILLADACRQPGFGKAVSFLFSPNAGKLTASGVLEALGHSFFTLSLGMGALITYGSYLSRDSDIVGAAFTISILDTVVALMACLILFPVLFSFGMSSQAGPGLVFKSMPIAFGQMAGGSLLGVTFFILLLFAALTSAISLLEVVVATFIDQMGWGRRKATLVLGTAIFLFGLPSAAAGADKIFPFWDDLFGKNFFDSFDYVASNWLLPLGGFFIAVGT